MADDWADADLADELLRQAEYDHAKEMEEVAERGSGGGLARGGGSGGGAGAPEPDDDVEERPGTAAGGGGRRSGTTASLGTSSSVGDASPSLGGSGSLKRSRTGGRCVRERGRLNFKRRRSHAVTPRTPARRREHTVAGALVRGIRWRGCVWRASGGVS